MQSWPTAFQETLDDPWAGCLQQLQVRLPGRNHTLGEARGILFMYTGQAKQAGEDTGGVVPPMREGHMVQADDPPRPTRFAHGSPPGPPGPPGRARPRRTP